jgi:hypothetical protein
MANLGHDDMSADAWETHLIGNFTPYGIFACTEMGSKKLCWLLKTVLAPIRTIGRPVSAPNTGERAFLSRPAQHELISGPRIVAENEQVP